MRIFGNISVNNRTLKIFEFKQLLASFVLWIFSWTQHKHGHGHGHNISQNIRKYKVQMKLKVVRVLEYFQYLLKAMFYYLPLRTYCQNVHFYVFLKIGPDSRIRNVLKIILNQAKLQITFVLKL